MIAAFVHHFWVFESATGLPSDDARIVVPNGRPKLIVPWRNGLTARRAADRDGTGRREDSAVVIGQWEEATVIASTPEPTVTIGVELQPHGLTRFFPVDARELAGRIVPVADVLGAAARALTDRAGEASTPESAARVVHDFLLARFCASNPQPVALTASLSMLAAGPTPMRELERRTGYSRRYLQEVFLRHVGLPPKRLSGVLVFERLYRVFSQDRSASRLRRDALDVFYDQSHFNRAFRRYTGLAPGRFAELENEFGRVFYSTSASR